MNFKQMTSLLSLTVLLTSVDAFAGKDPLKEEKGGKTGKVSKTLPKSDNDKKTSGTGVMEVVDTEEPKVDTSTKPVVSKYDDLTVSTVGALGKAKQDTRGVWGFVAPTFLWGEGWLADMKALDKELSDAKAPELSDNGYSLQVRSYKENHTSVKDWSQGARAWYTQNGADQEWNREEAKRLMLEGVFNVRDMPFNVQVELLDPSFIKELAPWMQGNKFVNKLNYRATTKS